MRHFLRLGVVDQESFNETEHPRRQLVIQLAKSALIALRDPGQKFSRGGRSILVNMRREISCHESQHVSFSPDPYTWFGADAQLDWSSRSNFGGLIHVEAGRWPERESTLRE
ncbi:hypothetical protein GCM10027056_19960 [Glaciibacter psychrotolerans]